MNLSELSITQAKQYTSHFPLLLVGSNSSGKSFAVEAMDPADKARTVVLNWDLKPIGDGSETEFHSLYQAASTSENLDKQIGILTAKGKDLAAEDPKHPALPRLRAQVKELKKLKAQSFFIDDMEAIDKVVNVILDLTFNPDVDRLVTDTLTAMTDFCEAWANHNFDGREVWANYGVAHQRILQAIKEATIFGYKYTYVMAHHDFIPAAQYATTPKQVVKVKGGIMSGNVEAHYNTIVFAHVTEDAKRVFECDNDNSLDTSRTKTVNGRFSFERSSLDDLEQLFAGTKQVVAGELVPKES